MNPHSPWTPPLPARSQPLIALVATACLAAGAVWFVAAGGHAGRLVHHDAPPPGDARFTVNVNDAGELELAQLPGLGPATARRIVDHRRAHGPFASLDELLDVPGIGPATLAAMRPHLRPIRRPIQRPSPRPGHLTRPAPEPRPEPNPDSLPR
ncbi:MAG: ComEA family DNA-binding protein [Planctomycetia bacterium]